MSRVIFLLCPRPGAKSTLTALTGQRRGTGSTIPRKGGRAARIPIPRNPCPPLSISVDRRLRNREPIRLVLPMRSRSLPPHRIPQSAELSQPGNRNFRRQESVPGRTLRAGRLGQENNLLAGEGIGGKLQG